RLTSEHELWLEVLRQGGSFEHAMELRKTHPNVIVRALGFDAELPIDLQYLAAQPQDLYLLCSDGLTRQLSDEVIRGIVTQRALGLAERSRQLVEAADRSAGHDNVTVLLVQRH